MSEVRFQLETEGPFPRRIDPFAEAARYFQQIHSGMIYELQQQLRRPLYDRGYQIGKEASLQVVARREPDLFVREQQPGREPADAVDYPTMAQQLDLSPGTYLFDDEVEEDALVIKRADTGEIVTVVEVVSPRNKTHPQQVLAYQDQRLRLFLAQHINVVEIDPTRSTRRLVDSRTLDAFPYHIAIHIPGDPPRALTSHFEEPLKPLALPLRGEAVPVDAHAAYTRAYQTGGIAGQLHTDEVYQRGTLPNPETLTAMQQEAAIIAAKAWITRLGTL
jgi:hypothetical protein